MLVGLIKPRILLPSTGLAEDELRLILKHEFIHCKRKDLLYKFLVLTAKAIHWFNPVVYLSGRAINLLCETSCDAEIVSGADEATRQTYSEAIIGVVKYQTKLKTILSTNFYGGSKGMKNRIASIMDVSKKKTGMVIVCMALVITLGTGIVFAANTEATETPRPVQNAANEAPQAIQNVANADNSTSPDDSGEWDEWLEWFISLSPEEQAQISLRPPAGVLENALKLNSMGNSVYIESSNINETYQPDSQSRRPSTVIFDEYGKWGLTIEGLAPHSDGGFIATPTQNVFFQGQLIRGFSDFGHGVDMSISSFDRGGEIWVHVVRDDNGNIKGLDME
jgi:hypothetical protein